MGMCLCQCDNRITIVFCVCFFVVVWELLERTDRYGGDFVMRVRACRCVLLTDYFIMIVFRARDHVCCIHHNYVNCATCST